MPRKIVRTKEQITPLPNSHPEAVPTFPTYRQKIEEKDGELRQEIDYFLGLLRVLGTPMVDDSEAHFVYYHPFAHEVKLGGDFPSWGWGGVPMKRLGTATGIFYFSVRVHAPARIEYKFQVDGQWVIDPYCPNRVENGVGGENSVLVVGRFDEPRELAWNPAIPHGQVEEFSISSRYMNNQRAVYVYLPAGYAQKPEETFPSLYVHDGGEYLTRARLAVALDNLIHSGDVPPLIAVMVNPVQREHEYMGNEDYAAFIEHELIPKIAGAYRAGNQRDVRAVMGASMGGFSATYLALTRPHLFSKAAGQSSAFFLNEDKIIGLAKGLSTPITFYFDVGKVETEFIPAHKRLIPILESKQCRCFYQEVRGGHNWTTWRAHLKELLAFLWSEGKPAPKRVTGKKAQPVAVGA